MAAAPGTRSSQSLEPVAKNQRVKLANLSVTKDGVFERPDPSWSTDKLDDIRSLQAEPWNVEGMSISGKGIEVLQYAGDYDHNNTQVGPRILKEDEIAWSVLFRQASMKDIRLREMKKLPSSKAKVSITFIEICFKYEGVPESKDATRLKTVGPEEAEDGEVEDLEYIEVEIEDEPQAPDQLNLAKLFTEPNEYKDLEVRIAFMRSPSNWKPFQWQWPPVLGFLRGREGWRPRYDASQTQYRVGLPLQEYILRFESHHDQFVAQPQKDKTTKWLINQRPDRQQQQPSTASPAVPAFGAPLPKAPQPTSTPTPTPTPESSQGSRKRTLEEIDAEEEDIDREEERLRARRRQLREERRQLY